MPGPALALRRLPHAFTGALTIQFKLYAVKVAGSCAGGLASMLQLFSLNLSLSSQDSDEGLHHHAASRHTQVSQQQAGAANTVGTSLQAVAIDLTANTVSSNASDGRGGAACLHVGTLIDQLDCKGGHLPWNSTTLQRWTEGRTTEALTWAHIHVQR